MRKILLAVLFIATIGGFSQTTIFDVDNVKFEDFNLTYQAEVADTAMYALENPDKSGVNTSDSVGMFVRGASTAADKWNKQLRIVTPCDTVWDVASAFPSDSMQGNVGAVTITMDVWTNVAAGSVFELSFSKTPDWPNYRHGTYRDTTTTSGQWETLSFTYDNLPPIDAGCCGNDPSTVPATDSVPIVFIAFGHGSENTSADTFYFDNIQMVDLMAGGNQEYCGDSGFVGAVVNKLQIADFTAVPNPAHDEVNLKYNIVEAGITEIELVDMTGKKVLTAMSETMQKSGIYNEKIDITLLEDGIYFMRVKHNDQIIVRKLIKN